MEKPYLLFPSFCRERRERSEIEQQFHRCHHGAVDDRQTTTSRISSLHDSSSYLLFQHASTHLANRNPNPKSPIPNLAQFIPCGFLHRVPQGNLQSRRVDRRHAPDRRHSRGATYRHLRHRKVAVQEWQERRPEDSPRFLQGQGHVHPVRVRRGRDDFTELQACIVPNDSAGKKVYMLRSISDPNYAVGFWRSLCFSKVLFLGLLMIEVSVVP